MSTGGNSFNIAQIFKFPVKLFYSILNTQLCHQTVTRTYKLWDDMLLESPYVVASGPEGFSVSQGKGRQSLFHVGFRV